MTNFPGWSPRAPRSIVWVGPACRRPPEVGWQPLFKLIILNAHSSRIERRRSIGSDMPSRSSASPRKCPNLEQY